MPDVFLSHSSKDKKVADAACAVLEQRGVRCWIAPRDVPPGMEWAEAIMSGLESCRVIVLVFSRHADESADVRREVGRALAKARIIIPFRIEDVKPTKAMDYYTSAVHWLDAFTPPLQSHLEKLADTILGFLGREREPARAAAPPAGSPTPGPATHGTPAAVAPLAAPPAVAPSVPVPTATTQDGARAVAPPAIPPRLGPAVHETPSAVTPPIAPSGGQLLFFKMLAGIAGAITGRIILRFEQGPTHPAANVSWEDAQAFCAWLTERERKAGKLGTNERYRLPTDHEWSCAVGIGDREYAAKSPKEKNKNLRDVFPWGSAWPPPKGSGKKGAGNYASSLGVDSYEHTSPAGSFAANQNGLHDMGGNVWEWCEDTYAAGDAARVLRGASWVDFERANLLSFCRGYDLPGDHYDYVGFRCVVGIGGSAP